MSGYREAPPVEVEKAEEMPDFRPKGIERALQLTWTFYLVWPVVFLSSRSGITGWADLRAELIFWIEHSPLALALFVAWWLLRRFRGEDVAARARFDQAEPRFDPPRKDIL